MTYSNIAEEDLKKPLSIYGVKLHVLSQGDQFDLIKREPSQMKPQKEKSLLDRVSTVTR